MSHITCPLCGLNSHVSRFEDTEVNHDIRLVSFRGLGRGKGFEVEEEDSILGDDFYSPLIAERMLSLIETFINEGVISFEDVDKRLRIKEHYLQSGDVVSKKRHEEILMVTRDLYNEDKVAQQNKTDSIDFSYRRQLEEKTKELNEEYILERELCIIVRYCDTEIMTDDKFPFIVTIKDFKEYGLGILYDISRRLNSELRKKLSKRIEASNPFVKTILRSNKLDKTYREKSVTNKIREIMYNR